MFKLIIGLGNPGRSYEATRHNVGFMLMDRIALAHGKAFQTEPKWQSHLCQLDDGTRLMKPQTFMNLSGRSINQLLSFYKWSPQDLLVVYDDVALPLGTLRFRQKGSSGGHNGIQSIIDHLGTPEFPRLKIGIGSSRPGELVGHVLGKFSPDEQPALENTLVSAVHAVQLAHQQGIESAANHYHTPRKPPEPSRPKENDPERNCSEEQ